MFSSLSVNAKKKFWGVPHRHVCNFWLRHIKKLQNFVQNSSVSDKAKFFAKSFSMNSNLEDSGIPLHACLSRTNLKLHNISITPKIGKKVKKNIDWSNVYGPDCIPVMVLKNCEPELLYELAELFNMYMKESCFWSCWEVSSVVHVFKNVGERSTAKNYCPFSLLSEATKAFEILVTNSLVDHLEKCGLLISSMLLGLLS